MRREQAIAADSLARAEREHEYGRTAPVEVVVKPFARVVCEDLCDGRIRCVLRRLVVEQPLRLLHPRAVAARVRDRVDRQEPSVDVDQGDRTELYAVKRAGAHVGEAECNRAVHWSRRRLRVRRRGRRRRRRAGRRLDDGEAAVAGLPLLRRLKVADAAERRTHACIQHAGRPAHRVSCRVVVGGDELVLDRLHGGGSERQLEQGRADRREIHVAPLGRQAAVDASGRDLARVGRAAARVARLCYADRRAIGGPQSHFGDLQAAAS